MHLDSTLRARLDTELYKKPNDLKPELKQLFGEMEKKEHWRDAAWLANLLGVASGMTGVVDSAEYWFSTAKEIAEANGLRDLQTQAQLNLGVNSSARGHYLLAAQTYIELVEPLEAERDTQNLGVVWVNLANIYGVQKDYGQALKYSLKATEAFRALGNKRRLAMTLGGQGILHARLGNPTAGIRDIEEAIALSDELGVPGLKVSAYNNLASIYADKGEKAKALNYYYKNLALAQNGNFTDDYALLLGNIGKTLTEMGRTAEAKPVLDSAMYYAKQVGDPNVLYRQQRNQAHWLFAVGKYKEAFELLEIYHHNKDSLHQANSTAKIAELETSYATERKERLLKEKEVQLAQRALEVAKRNRYLAISGVFIFFMAVGGGFWVRQERQKRAQLQREAELRDRLARAELQNRLHNEKLRISQDLHDNIGAYITLLISGLEGVELPTETANAPETRAQNLELQELARTTMQELRNTVWVLNKEQPTLDEIGARLQDLLGRISRADGPQLHLSTRGEVHRQLDSDLALHLFRLVQEAVNNALKYANAQNLWIELALDPTTGLRVTVRDDGLGFDTTRPSMGFGLRNMNQRVKAAGGQLTVTSAPGKGTQVIATFAPLPTVVGAGSAS
jgi:signal transduction histidine kinase